MTALNALERDLIKIAQDKTKHLLVKVQAIRILALLDYQKLTKKEV